MSCLSFSSLRRSAGTGITDRFGDHLDRDPGLLAQVVAQAEQRTADDDAAGADADLLDQGGIGLDHAGLFLLLGIHFGFGLGGGVFGVRHDVCSFFGQAGRTILSRQRCCRR